MDDNDTQHYNGADDDDTQYYDSSDDDDFNAFNSCFFNNYFFHPLFYGEDCTNHCCSPGS